jgi:two-component system sensor histidine kinase KdpD
MHSAAEVAAGAIAEAVGATTVAVVCDRLPLAVHVNGHDLQPTSPEAAAALQNDPSNTLVVEVPTVIVCGPVRLVVVGPIDEDLDEIAEVVGLGLDLANAREQAARAERLAALKSDFAAVAGHEIRSPLTTIVGALQTVERLGTADRKTLDLIRGASARADRLRVLVEDLLMTARIDGRGVPVRPRLMCVVDTAREVASDDGRVTVTSTGRVPAVRTDGDHVRRILTVLVDNARTHAPGSVIEIAARELSGGVELTVADHGRGLPEDVAREPFSGTHLSATGLGLGLKIASGLTEAIGGSLAYRPTPGGGATFVLTVPPAI